MKRRLGQGLPGTNAEWEERPYFLWDLDMSWREFHGCLGSPNPTLRTWALARLLTHGRWDDIWRLVTLDEVAHDLPAVVMRDREFWEALVNAA